MISVFALYANTCLHIFCFFFCLPFRKIIFLFGRSFLALPSPSLLFGPPFSIFLLFARGRCGLFFLLPRGAPSPVTVPFKRYGEKASEYSAPRKPPKKQDAAKDADRIVTVAKKGDLAARRLAASRLVEPKAVQKLFDKIAPAMKDRKGGYTRIVKLGTRKGDAAEMCVLQWVTAAEVAEPAKDEPAKEVK